MTEEHKRDMFDEMRDEFAFETMCAAICSVAAIPDGALESQLEQVKNHTCSDPFCPQANEINVATIEAVIEFRNKLVELRDKGITLRQEVAEHDKAKAASGIGPPTDISLN